MTNRTYRYKNNVRVEHRRPHQVIRICELFSGLLNDEDDVLTAAESIDLRVKTELRNPTAHTEKLTKSGDSRHQPRKDQTETICLP